MLIRGVATGDLGYHLQRKTKFNEIETKFYAARTLMGIAALHEKDIVYRYNADRWR